MNEQVDSKKWGYELRKIGIGLYIVLCLVEIAMYFVLGGQGLVEQEIKTYILLYIVRPISISTVIMLVGSFVITKVPSQKYKGYVQLIMITLMFGNAVWIHNVFLVSFVLFCIPIFLSVVYQDKKTA